MRLRVDRYRASVEALERATVDPGGRPTSVPAFAVQPSGSRFGQLEQSKAELMGRASAGMRAVFEAFGIPAQVVAVLRGYGKELWVRHNQPDSPRITEPGASVSSSCSSLPKSPSGLVCRKFVDLLR